MSIKTVYLLMAEFNSSHIRLEDLCGTYLDMEYPRACRLAARQKLPFPVIRTAGQKSPWMVQVEDLAKYLDKMREEAAEKWRAAS